ncbi:MAG: phosphoribosylanthranilate isomerase [Alphaproteobacteria bacterium]|nr:phosphoribosylanthranilate isomerase [Alphaproteobacteria bacterium]
MTFVKICGLSTRQSVEVACNAGADYVGFVFFPRSPRNISYEQAAILARLLPPSTPSVAVMVNPDDVQLLTMKSIFEPDFIQLHGNESPERLNHIRALTGCQIIKALPIAAKSDLKNIDLFDKAADIVLLDAKTPSGTLPGGMGLSFDWNLLKNSTPSIPWMLSGGLNADNVKEALLLTDAPAVDVSSGVESSPGIKDLSKIKAFIAAVKA